MEKVRTIELYDSYEKDRELHTFFVYRGWCARKGGKMCFHISKYIRAKSNFCNYTQDDVFTMDSSRFDTPEYFKEVVDGHCEYLIRAFGSLENAYALNR